MSRDDTILISELIHKSTSIVPQNSTLMTLGCILYGQYLEGSVVPSMFDQ